MQKHLLLLIALIGFGINTMAQTVTRQNLSIFPKAEKGYKKMVIDVPYSDNDENKRIEFSIGKWMEVDGCNHFSLLGSLEKKDGAIIIISSKQMVRLALQ